MCTIDSYLTSVLLAALRTYDVGILASEVHVLDVALQRHFMKVLIAVRAALSSVPILLGRGRRCRRRHHGQA